MTRLNPVLAILRLFDKERWIWTVEEIAKALDVSQSTAYRHVSSLYNEGLLDPVMGAGYVLGPAFIEFDYLLRTGDPLIQQAIPHMRALLEETSQSATILLCRRFKDCVMCVHQETGSVPHRPTGYQRGVIMPLFVGATSKIILSHLPYRAVRRLFDENRETVERIWGTDSFDGFRAQLRTIARAGYVQTESEITEGQIGIAAPIFRNGQVVASLSFVIGPITAKERDGIAAFPERLMEKSQLITSALETMSAAISRS